MKAPFIAVACVFAVIVFCGFQHPSTQHKTRKTEQPVSNAADQKIPGAAANREVNLDQRASVPPEIAVRSLKDRFDWTILICTTILTLVGTAGTIVALRTLYAIKRQAAIMDGHRISLEQLAKAAAGNAEAASKNAESSRLNAEEQARVARIMEHDLRYRVTPHLQFRSLSGSVSDLPAEVQNVGRGVAESVTGVVTYVPSDRQEELILPGWIEPDKVRNVRIHQKPGETGYCVKLSCTDSVGLNTYTFTRDQEGRINVVREPRRAEI